MLRIIRCELLKLRRSKMLPFSIAGVLSTPAMLFIEALQTHLRHPETYFTLTDIFDHGLLYMMLLTNLTIYVSLTAHLFSHEYTDNTLKTLLPVPVPRVRFLMGKFCLLFMWTFLLSVVTWTGVFALTGLYHAWIGMHGFSLGIALVWLRKFSAASVLMFLTLTPFAYIAEKTKGVIAPVIASAVVVMGSAALCNQDMGALYPWTASFFIIKGSLTDTGYPLTLSVGILVLLSGASLLLTLWHFASADFD